MHWLDRLERRFGRYSIPNLMNIVLIGQVAVWFITMFVNYGVYSLLLLTRSGLAHLELWRLVSFIFVPSLQTNLFYFALEIYFYWWLATRWSAPGAISALWSTGWPAWSAPSSAA